MKRILSLIIAMAIVMTSFGSVTLADSVVWDGTVDFSWYDANEAEFHISTAEEFVGLLYNADKFSGKTIYLDSDIYLNDTFTWEADGTISDEGLTKLEIPADYRFKGTLEGNNHTISGIYVNASNAHWGIFRRAEDCLIRNLNFSNCYMFTSQGYLGAVIGVNNGGTVENVSIDNSYIKANFAVGGLVGKNDSYNGATEVIPGIIDSCTVGSDVTVTATAGGAGGVTSTNDDEAGVNPDNRVTIKNTICGANVVASGWGGGITGENKGIIDGCTFTGTVTKSGSNSEAFGGIAGSNRVDNLRIGSVKNCAVIGATLNGHTWNGIGGVVGLSERAAVENSYCVHSKITNTISHAAGVVGSILNGGSVKNCYSYNNEYTSEFGNIGGVISGENGTASYCYSDYSPVIKNAAITQTNCEVAEPGHELAATLSAQVTEENGYKTWSYFEDVGYVYFTDSAPVETPVPTETPIPTASPIPTETPVPTDTPEPTEVPTPSPEPTATPEPTPGPTATPAPVGESFKIFSNPIYTGNSNVGRAYVFVLNPDARVFGNSGSTSVYTRYFSAGDGIIHEPTAGKLDGLNTRVIVSHRAGLWERRNNGGGFEVMLAKDSDLAAVVTYMEDGEFKKSPAFRFTGFHYNAKQGEDFGPRGTVTEFDLGTYPNVISVNVYHILSSPTDTTNSYQYSEPYHEYVQFDVMGDAGEAILPVEGKYYIEKDVLPSADLGVPMATPVPLAEQPTGGDLPEPYVEPGEINTTSPVVPYGVGTVFTLFPEDLVWNANGILSSDAGELGDLDVNVAPTMNANHGVVTYEVPEGGSVAAFTAYSQLTARVIGAEGIKANYIPTPGRLKGVITEVKAFQWMTSGDSRSRPVAIIKYDGGKEKVVDYFPSSFDSKYFLNDMISLGSYLNLESVTIETTGTGEQYFPTLRFQVVNDTPDKVAPVLNNRVYTKPNIATVVPSAVTIDPVPTVESPLVVNEAVSSNKNGIVASDGERYDWIEIYNTSNEDIDVSGYGLTDSPKNPYKWVFPEGSVMPANSFTVIFASSKDTVENGEIHTSYNLSTETVMLSDLAGEILSVLEIPEMDKDKSIARVPDGSNNLAVSEQTPGATNDKAEAPFIVAPELSAKSGFYPEPFELTINAPSGTVYYTLDGSEPTTESMVYDGPISIYNPSNEPNVLSAIKYNSCDFAPTVPVDKAMVVRAVAIDDNGNRSEVKTRTYFVDYDMAEDFNNAMVISMTTDAENLYDDDFGIFTNVEEQRREFERRVHLDIFDADGSLVINQDAGARVRGFGHKYKIQKGINFYARSDYGEKKFEYPLFENAIAQYNGEVIQEHDSFALRHGSTNYGRFMFKDGQAQGLAGETGAAFQAQRPAVLFINGEYWGLYYMAERATDDYVEAHFGIPKEDVVVIKNHMNTGDATAADLQLYNDDLQFLANTDFTIPENYQKLAAKFDLHDLAIYYSANINLQSGDWIGYNFCTWRSRYITDRPYEDGKWRFMMYDVDTAYDGNYVMGGYFQGAERGWGVALMNNPSLKKIFANIMLDNYANELSPETTFDDLKCWYEESIPHYPAMHDRWNLSDNAAGEVAAMYKMMLKLRPQHLKDIEKQFGLTGDLAYLNVRVSDPKGGTVKVNYMDRDFSTGSFNTWNYTDYTSTLEATAYPGYKFLGWTVSEGTSLTSATDTITHVTLASNGSVVTAVFVSEGEITLNYSAGSVVVTSDYAVEGQLIFAQFNSDGFLEKTRIRDFSSEKGDSMEVPTDLSTANGSYIKVMLVKDVANISPLAKDIMITALN